LATTVTIKKDDKSSSITVTSPETVEADVLQKYKIN